MPLIQYPLDIPWFLRKRKALRRELQAADHPISSRIAILGGVTTSELRASLEVLLLSRGIAPVFYESEYNRFFEDAVLDTQRLVEFRPDLIYFCTSSRNLRSFPRVLAEAEEIAGDVRRELAPFRQAWEAVWRAIPACTILQNNFEPLPLRPLGNLEGAAPYGTDSFLNRLNGELAGEGFLNPRLLVVDAHGLASSLGTQRWFSPAAWFSYKMAQTPEAAVYLANALSALIAAVYGLSRKCLVLDLDNTLWGGVIGDDGVDQIQLGKETAVAEAYSAFHHYCRRLRDRGVLLAVCSKNDEASARQGFTHPDSILQLTDFSAFYANWNPKDQSIAAIARDLNIGLDSLVFVDDNPAERELVRSRLPSVAVPEVGSDVSRFPEILDEAGYFEASGISKEDSERSRLYAENAQRQEVESTFQDYGEYLISLRMEGEIRPFSPLYLDRIAQLTNKTNQFNLTTRRYTRAELEALAARPNCVALYGRLVDRFGDNGLVTVVMGFVEDGTLEIDLWLMSCRVLKRDMELAMLDNLVGAAVAKGATRLLGRYIRSPKNNMVADHYDRLGFRCIDRSADDSSSVWELPVGLLRYQPRNRYIKERAPDQS